jgi:hypothetical protein
LIALSRSGELAARKLSAARTADRISIAFRPGNAWTKADAVLRHNLPTPALVPDPAKTREKTAAVQVRVA